MSWRIVYVEKSDYISSYLDNLKIKKGIDEIKIPFSDINSIIIDNNQTTITTGLINKCVEYKINLVICDYFHLPSSILLPYSGNYQTSLVLFNQLNWKKESKEYIWKEIVKAKIFNQKTVLRLTHKSTEIIDLLEKYINEVEEGDVTNREGLAAKAYFRELFGKNFNRNEDNIINASLNYGYSIIRSQICRSLVARGLNPHFGIFHKGIGNGFNLADDLIEVYRPIVDLWVYRNINNYDIFNKDIRINLINLTTKKIRYGNSNITIINSINSFINQIIDFFETGIISEMVIPNVEYNE